MADSNTTDPEAWTDKKLYEEIAFILSPMGRLRRDDREVALAVEIVRLRAALEAIKFHSIDQPAARNAPNEEWQTRLRQRFQWIAMEALEPDDGVKPISVV